MASGFAELHELYFDLIDFAIVHLLLQAVLLLFLGELVKGKFLRRLAQRRALHSLCPRVNLLPTIEDPEDKSKNKGVLAELFGWHLPERYLHDDSDDMANLLASHLIHGASLQDLDVVFESFPNYLKSFFGNATEGRGIELFDDSAGVLKDGKEFSKDFYPAFLVVA